MKRICILATLLFLCLGNLAQELKWSFGVVGAPVNYIIKPGVGFEHEYTLPQWSWLAGLDINYKVTPHSEFNTNLFISKTIYQIDYNYIFQQAGDPFIPRHSTFSGTYFEIPIQYNYAFFPARKLNLCFLGGIFTTFALVTSETTTYEDNSVRDSGYLNSFLFGFQIGTCLRYHLNEKLAIKVNPTFRFYLRKFDDQMGRFPRAFAGMAGLIYKL